jgi:hypothetical protein
MAKEYKRFPIRGQKAEKANAVQKELRVYPV